MGHGEAPCRGHDVSYQARGEKPDSINQCCGHTPDEEALMLRRPAQDVRELGEAGGPVGVVIALEGQQGHQHQGNIQSLPDLPRAVERLGQLPRSAIQQGANHLRNGVHHRKNTDGYQGDQDPHHVPQDGLGAGDALDLQQLDIKRKQRQHLHNIRPRTAPADTQLGQHGQPLHRREQQAKRHGGGQVGRGDPGHGVVADVVGGHHQDEPPYHGQGRGEPGDAGGAGHAVRLPLIKSVQAPSTGRHRIIPVRPAPHHRILRLHTRHRARTRKGLPHPAPVRDVRPRRLPGHVPVRPVTHRPGRAGLAAVAGLAGNVGVERGGVVPRGAHAVHGPGPPLEEGDAVRQAADAEGGPGVGSEVPHGTSPALPLPRLRLVRPGGAQAARRLPALLRHAPRGADGALGAAWLALGGAGLAEDAKTAYFARPWITPLARPVLRPHNGPCRASIQLVRGPHRTELLRADGPTRIVNQAVAPAEGVDPGETLGLRKFSDHLDSGASWLDLPELKRSEAVTDVVVLYEPRQALKLQGLGQLEQRRPHLRVPVIDVPHGVPGVQPQPEGHRRAPHGVIGVRRPGLVAEPAVAGAGGLVLRLHLLHAPAAEPVDDVRVDEVGPVYPRSALSDLHHLLLAAIHPGLPHVQPLLGPPHAGAHHRHILPEVPQLPHSAPQAHRLVLVQAGPDHAGGGVLEGLGHHPRALLRGGEVGVVKLLEAGEHLPPGLVVVLEQGREPVPHRHRQRGVLDHHSYAPVLQQVPHDVENDGIVPVQGRGEPEEVGVGRGAAEHRAGAERGEAGDVVDLPHVPVPHACAAAAVSNHRELRRPRLQAFDCGRDRGRRRALGVWSDLELQAVTGQQGVVRFDFVHGLLHDHLHRPHDIAQAPGVRAHG
mmetsp:Transcript_29674/g.76103  ORF Transcript_29674/g.76103 Transcript_29674/m.76103 type:complete len:882 (-) Transcript_29674:142-2787(-)